MPALIVLTILAIASASAAQPVLFDAVREMVPREVPPGSGYADLTGDGVADLGAPGRGVFVNDTTGHFQPHLPLSLPLHAANLLLDPNHLIVEDFTGDGRADVLVMSPQLDAFWVNDGSGVLYDQSAALILTTPTPPTPHERTLIPGDFDGNGSRDLLVTTGSYLQPPAFPLTLLLNVGPGALIETTPAPSVGLQNATAGVASDLDLDGDADAVLGGWGVSAAGAGSARWLVNTGSATFSVQTLPSFGSAQVVAAGQLDTDPHPDLLFVPIGAGLGNPCLVVMNPGAPQGPTATIALLPPGLAMDGALADLDGDEDLVIGTWANASAAPDLVYPNQGGGVLGSPQQLPGTPTNTRAVKLADLDLDGDLDIVTAGDTQTPSHVFYNVGGLVFTPPITLGSGMATHLAIGDVDGDGDLDIVLSDDYSATLHRNDGVGIWTPSPFLLPATQGPGRVLLADVDGDGDPDVVATVGVPAAPTRLFLNQGGQFALHQTLSLGSPSNTFATPNRAGDFDGDGDIDLVFGRDGFVLTNLQRQLSHPGPPRIGKPLLIEIHGPAYGPWHLFAASNRAVLDLGALGVLHLDPATTIALGAGALLPGGSDFRTFPLPLDPSLVGQSFYLQVWFASDARLSNLDVITVTGA